MPGQDQPPLPTLTPAVARWQPQHHSVFPCLIAFDLAVARETKSCSLGSICILISNYQQCCSSPAVACKVLAATWGCPAGVAGDALSLPALPSSLCRQESRAFGIDVPGQGGGLAEQGSVQMHGGPSVPAAALREESITVASAATAVLVCAAAAPSANACTCPCSST